MVRNSISEDFQSVPRVGYFVGGIKMAKPPKIERRCEKCGKPQPIIKEKSNENWNVYDTKAICECGGKYKFVQVGK